MRTVEISRQPPKRLRLFEGGIVTLEWRGPDGSWIILKVMPKQVAEILVRAQKAPARDIARAMMGR